MVEPLKANLETQNTETKSFNKFIASETQITPDINGLLPLIQKLDRRITQFISTLQKHRQAEQKYGITWVHKIEIVDDETPSQIPANSLIDWLQKTFELSPFDLDILTVTLAPEIDREYERIYAYIQDETSHKKPTVDLVLNLYCSNIVEKLSRRQHLTTNAPLISHGLLHLSSESTFLSQHLIINPQVVRLLLNQPGLDFRLTSYCQLRETNISADILYLNPDIQTKLQILVKEDWQKQQPLQLYFQGSDRSGKSNTAQFLAKTLKIPLLIADLAKLLEDKSNFQENLQLIWREAWFFQRLLYLENFDILYLPENQIPYQSFLKEIEKNRGITILSGIENWLPTTTGVKGLITITFTIPESSQRREYWQNYLNKLEISIEKKELDILSDRFRLTPNQIADAVATAYNTTRWQQISETKIENNSNFKTEKSQPSFIDLCSAARHQSGYDLINLARKIEPKYTWDDIVLQPKQLTQLENICKEAEYQNLVHNQWGFATKLSLGKGLNVLFSGIPGTGKTMAAEVIAHHLQLDLYKIDLSQIVSKYIGETEKNLNRIFTAATNSNAILLFDEADALFGKRTEIQDARDRYANIEVSYLLQKMEEYEGITILTTNLRSNMDEAFERRLRFIIEFSLPDTEHRLLIWQKIFPKKAPCSPELDIEFLAENFEITGANIRNIALTAAFLAADDKDNNRVIEMRHLIRAIRREYDKMGQILWDKNLGSYLNI
ncbi:ATP-binding protein [Dapis sp. BLCC M229]|uniref:ATP-binding protein n=1 Tax=Dapis sp. BLCC M229 TaxID=3400188 RepID=UPI003CEC0711